MRLHTRLFACVLAGGLLLGCHHPQTPPPVTGGDVPEDLRQQLATLAFLSYLGDALKGSDPEVASQLAVCLPQALEAQDGVGGWQLAWGPAVYKFDVAELDDNMMFVVREKANPAHLAVVVRGTNLEAILDWLVEDFDVVDQVGWPAGSGQPEISKGTSEGLHILQTLTAKTVTDEPRQEQEHTLASFLAAEAKRHPSGLALEFVGHSLGGALAPALALWVRDTVELGPSTLRVHTLAGPTSGNADFAAYYDSALPDTHRLWNPYDVVPRAWNHASMGQIADLYEPLTRANPLERGLINGLRSLTADKGYTQIKVAHPPLPGALQTQIPGKRMDWASQAGWQHHCGYQCALGIDVLTSIGSCPSSLPQYPCSACPDESAAGK